MLVLVASALLLGACNRDAVYRTTSPSSDGGSGLFYHGREIPAPGGEHNTVGWLERPDRESSELPDRLIAALELTPASIVADIGAGSGYLTFRIAPVVPHGRVYAVDIDEVLLDTINRRMEADSVTNVVSVLGDIDNPKLPSGVDLALIAISYHEFTKPLEMMSAIYDSLLPGGRVVLVEYRGEDETVPVGDLHRLTVAQATKELEYVGFNFREVLDILPQQHILIFEKPI